MRNHPITGKRSMHHGVDVAGTFPVTAAADGVVKHIGWSPTGGGHTVLINHGPIVTVYYHGAQATRLKVGQRVSAGDFVYTSGATGATTGAHLHFEVRVGPGGAWGDTKNPELYLGGADVLEENGELDKATWTAWQVALKGHGLYTGAIDGIPGRLTYTAVQLWAGVPVTEKLDDATKRGVQVRLGVDDDGVWGVSTVRELQKELLQGLAGIPTPAPEPIIAPPIVPIPEPEPAVEVVAPVMTREQVEAIRKRNQFNAMKDKK
jgi:murein DD-endopeptidase MepM/ murein hydrolase activator NlpD